MKSFAERVEERIEKYNDLAERGIERNRPPKDIENYADKRWHDWGMDDIGFDAFISLVIEDAQALSQKRHKK